MEDLRYPIGRFEPKGGSTGEERSELIDQIANAPGSMREAVAGLTDEQLDTPYREGGWTVRQVVHHLADSSINGYCASNGQPPRRIRRSECTTVRIGPSWPMQGQLRSRCRWTSSTRCIDAGWSSSRASAQTTSNGPSPIPSGENGPSTGCCNSTPGTDRTTWRT